MPSHPPNSADLLVFHSFRDRVLGSGAAIFGKIPWATDTALRERIARAADHHATELEKLSGMQNSPARIKRRQIFRLLGSFDARLCSLILAWPVSRKPISAVAAMQMAREVNPRTPSPEPVHTMLVMKPEGGFRRIWSFGPRARARQKLVVSILMALWGPAKFEFARRGRGRDKALGTVVTNAEQKGGARWFLTADIENCFGSFNRKALLETIPLPRSVIENSLFVMKGTEITHHKDDNLDTSEIAVLSGMPQGSLASPYIVSKLIEPQLEKLTSEMVLSHSDDIIVGCRTEKEAQSNMLLLDELMQAHPAGPLLMKASVARLGRPIDFLSYRVRRRWRLFGGGIRLTPSGKAFARFEQRLFHKVKDIPISSREETATDYMNAWMGSHRLWDRSLIGDDLVWLKMMNVLSDAFWKNVTKKSSLHDAQ